jgi:hypothetical protein
MGRGAMGHEQLYYPNLTPELSAEFAISLLHWDRVMRIFPKEGTTFFRPSTGIVHELEQRGLLVCEPLEDPDISETMHTFDKLMNVVTDRSDERSRILTNWIKPLTSLEKLAGRYRIYRGKANYSLSNLYPNYFCKSVDSMGNEVFLCARTTGLTYMTLLAYFLNRRKGFVNTITDQPACQPLFITLSRILVLGAEPTADHFVSFVDATEQVERIFFQPHYRILKPKVFEGEATYRKIMAFREKPEYDNLREVYLSLIDHFLSDLYQCANDDDVRTVVNQHEKKFQNHLQVLISACKAHGIPTETKIISQGRMSGWEFGGHVWDITCSVKDIVTMNVISVMKPLLKLKPSLDFYHNTLMHHDHYYPLLIQETFSPTYPQKVFHLLQRLYKIKVF